MSREPGKLPIAIIAEDEDLGRLLLADSTVMAGLSPLAFDNGVEALEAALNQESAIILLDVDMPGLDGYSVCRRIRAERRLARVPIVMVTGHNDTDAINQAFEAGATDYISKPVNWALLPHRLAYILRNAAAAERIERLAYFDVQTGLPNRQRCMDIAQEWIAASATKGIGFIFLKLGGFQRISETFGHSLAETALDGVAKKLQQTLQVFETATSNVSLARLGSHSFLILVRAETTRAFATDVANACGAALREPVLCNELEFFVAPSIGVAMFPEDGGDAETLLKHADIAVYQSRSSAVPTVVSYSAAMSARLRDYLELEAKLRRAVRHNQLSLRYQPKFRLSDNTVAGVEALIRWSDDEYGEISPNRFVPIAEETGLIIDIGKWIAQTVCQQLRAWLDLGAAVPIAVNLSGKELSYGDPARVIEMESARYGVPTSLIEAEITESVFVTDSNAGRSNVARLRKLGCKIALDDFGTGYSSLAYLTRFPPDRIKIDRSFVHHVDQRESDAAIVNAIMSLGKTLSLTVTAEGIERTSQLEWLRARGCHEAQGYLLSKPVSAEDFTRRFLLPQTDARQELSVLR